MAVVAAHPFTFDRKRDVGLLFIRMISSSCSDWRSAEIKGSESGPSSDRTNDQGSYYVSKSRRLPDWLSDGVVAVSVRSIILRDKTGFMTVSLNLCQIHSTFHRVFLLKPRQKY